MKSCTFPGIARRRTLFCVWLLALWLAAVPAGSHAQQGPRAGESDPHAPMREHMRDHMRGMVPPPGMTPAALPAPDSEGARLFVHFCTQCHDLPSPRYRTAQQWPPILERMTARMEMMAGGGMMGMAPVKSPTLEELNVLLAYTQAHALRQVTPEELRVGERTDRMAFLFACTQCHVTPAPALHAAADWPAVVARMQANMAAMGRPVLTPDQQAAIVRYLRVAAPAKAPAKAP